MDWSRAKNLIIMLLALVNVFLVGNIAYLAYKNDAAERNTVSELVAYLESRGIVLDREAVPRENLGRTVLIVEHNVGRCLRGGFLRAGTPGKGKTRVIFIKKSPKEKIWNKCKKLCRNC